MKIIATFILIALFSSCTEKSASHEDALKFYVTIVKASIRESNRYEEFKIVLKNAFETASGRDPQNWIHSS